MPSGYALAVLFLSAGIMEYAARRCSTPALLSVFTDFTYVGSAKADARGQAGAHGFLVKDLPSDLRPGVQYIFHLRRSAGDSNIWPVLVQRLQAHRIEVLRAPKSAKDLGHLVFGGPLFRIDFKCGGQKGTIYNLLESATATVAEARDWGSEDFVLMLQP